MININEHPVTGCTRLSMKSLRKDKILKKEDTMKQIKNKIYNELNTLISHIFENPTCNDLNNVFNRNIVVFGPEGTGKTFKVVKSFINSNHSKFLICPSNIQAEEKYNDLKEKFPNSSFKLVLSKSERIRELISGKNRSILKALKGLGTQSLSLSIFGVNKNFKLIDLDDKIFHSNAKIQGNAVHGCYQSNLILKHLTGLIEQRIASKHNNGLLIVTKLSDKLDSNIKIFKENYYYEQIPLTYCLQEHENLIRDEVEKILPKIKEALEEDKHLVIPQPINIPLIFKSAETGEEYQVTYISPRLLSYINKVMKQDIYNANNNPTKENGTFYIYEYYNFLDKKIKPFLKEITDFLDNIDLLDEEINHHDLVLKIQEIYDKYLGNSIIILDEVPIEYIKLKPIQNIIFGQEYSQAHMENVEDQEESLIKIMSQTYAKTTFRSDPIYIRLKDYRKYSKIIKHINKESNITLNKLDRFFRYAHQNQEIAPILFLPNLITTTAEILPTIILRLCNHDTYIMLEPESDELKHKQQLIEDKDYAELYILKDKTVKPLSKTKNINKLMSFIKETNLYGRNDRILFITQNYGNGDYNLITIKGSNNSIYRTDKESIELSNLISTHDLLYDGNLYFYDSPKYDRLALISVTSPAQINFIIGKTFKNILERRVENDTTKSTLNKICKRLLKLINHNDKSKNFFDILIGNLKLADEIGQTFGRLLGIRRFILEATEQAREDEVIEDIRSNKEITNKLHSYLWSLLKRFNKKKVISELVSPKVLGILACPNNDDSIFIKKITRNILKLRFKKKIKFRNDKFLSKVYTEPNNISKLTNYCNSYRKSLFESLKTMHERLYIFDKDLELKNEIEPKVLEKYLEFIEELQNSNIFNTIKLGAIIDEIKTVALELYYSVLKTSPGVMSSLISNALHKQIDKFTENLYHIRTDLLVDHLEKIQNHLNNINRTLGRVSFQIDRYSLKAFLKKYHEIKKNYNDYNKLHQLIIDKITFDYPAILLAIIIGTFINEINYAPPNKHLSLIRTLGELKQLFLQHYPHLNLFPYLFRKSEGCSSGFIRYHENIDKGDVYNQSLIYKNVEKSDKINSNKSSKEIKQHKEVILKSMRSINSDNRRILTIVNEFNIQDALFIGKSDHLLNRLLRHFSKRYNIELKELKDNKLLNKFKKFNKLEIPCITSLGGLVKDPPPKNRNKKWYKKPTELTQEYLKSIINKDKNNKFNLIIHTINNKRYININKIIFKLCKQTTFKIMNQIVERYVKIDEEIYPYKYYDANLLDISEMYRVPSLHTLIAYDVELEKTIEENNYKENYLVG